jgi:IS1 family transposase
MSQQPDYDEIPEVAPIDGLPTFVGNKKNKIWLWTAVNKGSAGILALTIGDRSAETFKPLGKIIKGWKCFFMLRMVALFIPSY